MGVRRGFDGGSGGLGMQEPTRSVFAGQRFQVPERSAAKTDLVGSRILRTEKVGSRIDAAIVSHRRAVSYGRARGCL